MQLYPETTVTLTHSRLGFHVHKGQEAHGPFPTLSAAIGTFHTCLETRTMKLQTPPHILRDLIRAIETRRRVTLAK